MPTGRHRSDPDRRTRDCAVYRLRPLVERYQTHAAKHGRCARRLHPHDRWSRGDVSLSCRLAERRSDRLYRRCTRNRMALGPHCDGGRPWPDPSTATHSTRTMLSYDHGRNRHTPAGYGPAGSFSPARVGGADVASSAATVCNRARSSCSCYQMRGAFSLRRSAPVASPSAGRTTMPPLRRRPTRR